MQRKRRDPPHRSRLRVRHVVGPAASVPLPVDPPSLVAKTALIPPPMGGPPSTRGSEASRMSPSPSRYSLKCSPEERKSIGSASCSCPSGPRILRVLGMCSGSCWHPREPSSAAKCDEKAPEIRQIQLPSGKHPLVAAQDRDRCAAPLERSEERRVGKEG